MNQQQLITYLKSLYNDPNKSDLELIKNYQRDLNAKGAKLKVDGIYGKNTINALKQYDADIVNKVTNNTSTPNVNNTPNTDVKSEPNVPIITNADGTVVKTLEKKERM